MLQGEWDRMLGAAREGDVHALGSLLEAAHEDLRAAAASVVRDRGLAGIAVEDVYADALLAALREFMSLRATSYVGFRYWFASIARNRLRALLRRARRLPTRPHDLEEVEEPRPTDPRPGMGPAMLRGMLTRLPSSQRVAYVLREGLALDWRTIGFVLECRAAPAARLLHFRALGRVKELASTRPELCPRERALLPRGAAAEGSRDPGFSSSRPGR